MSDNIEIMPTEPLRTEVENPTNHTQCFKENIYKIFLNTLFFICSTPLLIPSLVLMVFFCIQLKEIPEMIKILGWIVLFSVCGIIMDTLQFFHIKKTYMPIKDFFCALKKLYRKRYYHTTLRLIYFVSTFLVMFYGNKKIKQLANHEI
ncbi:hypothetical protein EDEG_02492 [Edhazardia aedis USNM 41457]|uniref:Uncharacterized protein n=1 Tax=Edhazardia aedis (strain USNM 41457) TaxID=1003232 RepID=J8ZU07_EDHAE|nr:hypothetical protein EDEG_02492 [Edhazardia aedis USNM 41457]|eukprot:EJW03133.1 hypothetical protein EDEG_02492 [Edhazardia aedis USNM 41457]